MKIIITCLKMPRNIIQKISLITTISRINEEQRKYFAPLVKGDGYFYHYALLKCCWMQLANFLRLVVLDKKLLNYNLN